MADGTRGKISQRDSYTAGPEQLRQKGTLEDEVIVFGRALVAKHRHLWVNTHVFGFEIPRGFEHRGET